MTDAGADLREGSLREASQSLASIAPRARTPEVAGAQEPPRPLRLARLPWGGTALAVDVAMLVAAAVVAELVSSEHAVSLVSTTAFSALVIAQLQARGMYRPPMQLQLVDTVRAVVTAAGVAFAIVVTLRVLLVEPQISAGQAVLLGLVATVLLVAGRTVLLLSERRARRAGEAGAPTLIPEFDTLRARASLAIRHPERG